MAVPPTIPSALAHAAFDMSEKPDLRRALRLARKAFVDALTPAELASVRPHLAATLEPDIAAARCVAAYVPVGREFPALAALDFASGRAQTALPFVESRDAPMRFFAWAPGGSLEPGPFGLLQPAPVTPVEPDLILVPLLGFDRALGRLGQGAGHYDRYLAGHPAARRIGLAWSCQEVEQVPGDPWDMPLHAIVTERERIGSPS